MLTLKKPIIFFDVETTGLNITSDQIIELAAYKILPNKEIIKYYSLFKPTVEISLEATQVHGISNDKLQHESIFKDKAQEIFEFFKDCDLGGYNVIRFDIPILIEELYRAGIHYNPLRNNVMDVFKILQEKEPRNLGVMYKYYTGKDMINAHTAEADIEATMEIFETQLKKYELVDDIETINKEIISKRKDGMQNVDFSGLFLHQKDNFYYAHGKHKGQKIDKSNVSYLDWMLKADFTYATKSVANMIKKRIETT